MCHRNPCRYSGQTVTGYDKELALYIRRMESARCSDPTCEFALQYRVRVVEEFRRLRTELDRVNIDRATLIDINSRLADEMTELENKVPHVMIRRWVRWFRGGWRV